MFRALLIAAVLLVLSACASAGKRDRASPRGPVTTVEVSNRNWADLTVYAIRSGMRVRLGSVVSMTTERLKLPPAILAGSGGIRLHVELLGSRQAHTTEAIQVQPGDRIQFDVQNHLAISSLSVWRGSEARGPVSQRGRFVQVVLHEDWLGFTTCEGSRPSAWVNVDHLAENEREPTIAHERQHVMSIQADGGCAGHKARRAASPDVVRLEMEAAGFCASARVWSRQEGVSLNAAIQKYAAWLASYGFGLSPEQAADAIRRRCEAT